MPKPAPDSSALPAAFEAWCVHQRQAGKLRRGASEAVYRAMWTALSTWCAGQSPALGIDDLGSRRLLAFLASRSGLLAPDGALTARHQWRLLNLVQRVQAHAAEQRQQPPSHAAARLIASLPAVRAANAGDRNEPPSHLPAALADQLQAHLRGPLAMPARWQVLRDRCGVALQLGAGLGPGDVRALHLGDVIILGGPSPLQPWQLRVAANGSAPAHVAAIAPWAGALLGTWLKLRQNQRLQGDWLLPSTRSGKPWGKVAQYESARRVLADAGLDADGGGSFRLRHTFAIRQLAAGIDADRLARWLGVVDPAVLLRYQQALPPGPAARQPAAACSTGEHDKLESGSPSGWVLPV